MFTEDQLLFIQACAKKRKNQGERSVFNLAVKSPHFTSEQINILDYISAECTRQHSGEMSVYDMATAWNYAWYNPYEGYTCGCGLYVHPSEFNPNAIHIPDCLDKNGYKISLGWIEWVGRLVEPFDNANGFRTVQVGIYTPTGFHEFTHWSNITRMLGTLIDSFNEGILTPDNPLATDSIDQFYFHYEGDIHPFRDGNGRSGKIIYNWMKGTLDNPIMPPNFFDSAAP